MKLLVIDCCMRGDASYTRKYYEAYLKTLKADVIIEKLYLCSEELKPMMWHDMEKRDALLKSGNTEHPMFDYARQFAAADEILIAAPYWDLSFPSLLKVYLERVSVVGITFGYEGTDCVGYCKSKLIRYFSACGGYAERHLGGEYVRRLGEMFGIKETKEYLIEGMDIDPNMREELLNEAISKL